MNMVVLALLPPGVLLPPKVYGWDMRYNRPSPVDLPADDEAFHLSVGNTAQVTCVSASPFSPSVFLAGQSDGAVFVYTTKRSSPVLAFLDVGRGGIRAVKWSPTNACTFLVLDSSSYLHVFDLQASTTRPVHEVSCSQLGSEQQACSLAVSNASNGTQPGTGGFAIGYSDGTVQHHVMPPPRPLGPPEAEADALPAVLGLQL